MIDALRLRQNVLRKIMYLLLNYNNNFNISILINKIYIIRLIMYRDFYYLLTPN